MVWLLGCVGELGDATDMTLAIRGVLSLVEHDLDTPCTQYCLNAMTIRFSKLFEVL